MRTAEVTAPCIAVGIELDEANWAEVSVNSPKDGQQNGMVHRRRRMVRARPAAKHVAQLLGNSLVGIFNREAGFDREVAEVSDAPLLERISFQTLGSRAGSWLIARETFRGPKSRAPGGRVVPPSKGMPINARSSSSGRGMCGSRMNVGTPEKRGVDQSVRRRGGAVSLFSLLS